MESFPTPHSQPDPVVALQNLRARAERHRAVSASLPPESAPEVQRLVQELQVHQIELEMQYEELLLAQADAENSRAQYVDLYDFAPVGYCTLSLTGTLQQLNLRMGQLLDRTRKQLLGRRLALFVEPSARHQFAEFLGSLQQVPGRRQTCELPMRRHDETAFIAQLEGIVPVDEYEVSLEPPTFRLVLLDVTERHRVAAALATSEARFRATFEQSRAGMLLLEDHHFTDLNDAALWLLRRTSRSQILGHHVGEFWPEHQPDGRRSLDLLTACLVQAQQQGWCQLELARLDTAGLPIWDELSFNPVLVQGQNLVQITLRDMTDRRRLQQAQLDQQQQLAQAVLAAEEAEKRRISESLHNGLAQLLYATKLSLNKLGEQLGPSPSPTAAEAQRKATELLSTAIVQTRTLSHELLPRTLEDFGLAAALQDICADYSVAPLRMNCRVAKLPGLLPPHLALALYRMAQELANNIVKHAQATQASLSVTCQGQELELRADDNGVGFEHTLDPQKTKGVGMQVLLDRVRLLNGTLTVVDKQGTHVSIKLPLPRS